MAKRTSIKQWRTTLCLIYHGIDVLSYYRDPILAIVKNVAFVKGIECAIICGNGGWRRGRSLLNINPEELEPDYVHFRSETRPLIGRVEFEKMLAPLMPSLIDGVQAFFLYQYEVKDLPFPSTSDVAPFDYGLS